MKIWARSHLLNKKGPGASQRSLLQKWSSGWLRNETAFRMHTQLMIFFFLPPIQGVRLREPALSPLFCRSLSPGSEVPASAASRCRWEPAIVNRGSTAQARLTAVPNACLTCTDARSVETDRQRWGGRAAPPPADSQMTVFRLDCSTHAGEQLHLPKNVPRPQPRLPITRRGTLANRHC